MPNPYTGTDNDPFQEAQHRYLGPEWERFFGSLKGKNVRFATGGPGQAPEPTGYLGPGPEFDTARNYAVDAYGDQQKLLAQQLRGATAASDIAEASAQQAKSGVADREALDRALQGGLTPSPIVARGAGMYTATTEPAAGPVDPVAARAAILEKLPGHLRPAYEAQFAAQDAANRSALLAERKQAEVERHNTETEAVNKPFVPPVDPATGAPLTGDAMLKTLPPSKQALISSVLAGKQAIPTGAALKDPYWKGVIETANLIDPNFDTVNYNARANTRKDFTSGKAATQINAINTVVGHLHDLAAEGKNLGNTGMDWLNSIYNTLTPGGSKRGVAINNFETLKEGVANELMRTWRQVGAGSEKEIEDWKATIGAAKSPQELQGAFKTVGGMLESKLDALDSQYKQGMGTDRVSAITPESRKKLDALQGLEGAKTTVGAPKPPPGLVEMVAPDGGLLHVPAAQVDALLKAGAKRTGGS
jgi:hypothetical protein